MTNSKHPALDVTATNGVPFRVVLLLDGKSDNFPAASEQTEPQVEFYDLRYRNVRGFTPDGQFVSRYYLETLVGRDRRYGLDLQGDVSDWTIDASTMVSVILWLRDAFRAASSIVLLRAQDEEQEAKRELVWDRLSELLPANFLRPHGDTVSIEAVAELLDIIEGLKAEVTRLQAFLPPIDESSVDL